MFDNLIKLAGKNPLLFFISFQIFMVGGGFGLTYKMTDFIFTIKQQHNSQLNNQNKIISHTDTILSRTSDIDEIKQNTKDIKEDTSTIKTIVDRRG